MRLRAYSGAAQGDRVRVAHDARALSAGRWSTAVRHGPAMDAKASANRLTHAFVIDCIAEDLGVDHVVRRCRRNLLPVVGVQVAQEGVDDGRLYTQLAQDSRRSPPKIVTVPPGCSTGAIDGVLRSVPVAQRSAARRGE